jgi:hypothetical protein
MGGECFACVQNTRRVTHLNLGLPVLSYCVGVADYLLRLMANSKKQDMVSHVEQAVCNETNDIGQST